MASNRCVRARTAVFASLALLVASLAARGQADAGTDCQPGWLPTFGSASGINGSVWAATVFDDGGGPALYVGGFFVFAGSTSVNHVAKWDGLGWSALAGGMNNVVYDLLVFDDGTGPALYAGGGFTTAGGVAANRVAKWDGKSWSPLGSGIQDNGVWALEVFDDGSGPALHVAGDFIVAGDVVANRIAKWDGADWSALTAGLNSPVLDLVVHDDGSGPALFAGGSFTEAGGVFASRIAKWNGSNWSALDSGLTSSGFASVLALAVHDDGSGPALYAGGNFTSAGGVSANSIARWSSSSWSALGSGTNGIVDGLTVFDDGGGPVLVAGGQFTTAGDVGAERVARWDGTAWTPMGSGLQGESVYVLAAVDLGGPVLVAGGLIDGAGTVATPALAVWSGASWSALQTGEGPSAEVRALAVYDDGLGPALYAAGGFTSVGSLPAAHIARWDGTSWSALGTGLDGPVQALAVYDDGTGPKLYAAGQFSVAGGVVASDIAAWDGRTWSEVGGGVTGGGFFLGGPPVVQALAVYDDGSGLALYVGGKLGSVGSVPATGIARWNGAAWSEVGGGLWIGGIPELEPEVTSLAVFDDGSGRGLYVGGFFSGAGNVSGPSVLRWDGVWSSLGDSGVDTSVLAMANFDDGGGPALYLGGQFTYIVTPAGVTTAGYVARWDGTDWSVPGSGMDQPVHALSVFDDGDGPRLFAGGDFMTASGVPAERIAAWDGGSWSALGSGVDGAVLALAGLDDGSARRLFVGGSFAQALDSHDSYLAAWGACAPPPSAWTDLGYALAGAAGDPLLDGSGDLAPGSAGALVLSQAAPSAAAILFLSLSGLPTPFKCGTLVPVPVALEFPVSVDVGGTSQLTWKKWPAGLSGATLQVQFAIDDAAAACGVALSNALQASVP